jgi:hypothetical protein
MIFFHYKCESQLIIERYEPPITEWNGKPPTARHFTAIEWYKERSGNSSPQ